ncbi:MAG: radical SAM protein [Planctomycetota bacterium]
MKLLLLNPYFGNVKDRSSEAATNSPPLGLGYLGSYVKEHSNWEVEIVDPVPQGLSEADVLEKVRGADIVGLGCFTDTRFICFDFAGKARQVNKDCLLMIGGPFAYFLDEHILRNNPCVDMVVRGEAEHTVVDIINGRPLAEVDGITYRQSSQIVRNKDRGLDPEIDKFHIDYSLLPDFSLYRPDIEGDFATKKLRTAYIILSRGCPFRCTYCANDHWQRKWRIVSPETAVSQMIMLKHRYGIEFFRFYDDLFTANEEWVYRFCDLLKKANLGVKFRVLSRVGTKKEVMEALYEVGCIGVGLGIESGSDRMLNTIRKGFTSAQALRTINDCRSIGLWTVCSFIISLPGETAEDRRQTLSLTRLADFFMVNVLHLHPGTPLYNDLKAAGQITDDVWFDRSMPTTIHFSKEFFPDAPLSFKDAQWISLKARYLEIMFSPLRRVKEYGFLIGLLWVLFALIDMPFKGGLHKRAFIFRNLYRRLLWRTA